MYEVIRVMVEIRPQAGLDVLHQALTLLHQALTLLHQAMTLLHQATRSPDTYILIFD